MKLLKKKGFSMLELLITMSILCMLFSISTYMDYVYTKDQAKVLNEDLETFLSISEDIQSSLNRNGKPIKVSNGYITFKDIDTDCLYSYVYYFEDKIIKKVVDQNCTSNLNTRTLYKENISNVVFKDTGNDTYSFEINYDNVEDKLIKPFLYSLHVPKYTLN
jgi:prepilin-type N-terminal cleavage/methylation domain-containing protein